MTKVTFWLTERSKRALTAAAEQMGDSHTDTLNQAITLYAQIIQAHNEGNSSQRFVMASAPGKPCRVEVNRPRWRFW
jgi:hypothetical protein